MGRLGNITFRDVCRAAESLGWRYHHESGSHIIYKRNPGDGHLSIPKHGELRAGTIRTLIADMGITVDEFNRLRR